MKKEYDFSKGERGKFYNAGANLNIPVYSELEIQTFFIELAKKKK